MALYAIKVGTGDGSAQQIVLADSPAGALAALEQLWTEHGLTRGTDRGQVITIGPASPVNFVPVVDAVLNLPPYIWPDPSTPGHYIDAWNGHYDNRDDALDQTEGADGRPWVLAHGEGLISEDEMNRRALGPTGGWLVLVGQGYPARADEDGMNVALFASEEEADEWIADHPRAQNACSIETTRL